MNSIISHRMFVAALSNDKHVPNPSMRHPRREGNGTKRNVSGNLGSTALAALAVKPWADWPLRGLQEQSAL